MEGPTEEPAEEGKKSISGNNLRGERRRVELHFPNTMNSPPLTSSCVFSSPHAIEKIGMVMRPRVSSSILLIIRWMRSVLLQTFDHNQDQYKFNVT